MKNGKSGALEDLTMDPRCLPKQLEIEKCCLNKKIFSNTGNYQKNGNSNDVEDLMMDPRGLSKQLEIEKCCSNKKHSVTLAMIKKWKFW